MIKIFHICFPQIKNKIKFARHIKIALLVGTILNIINQFDKVIMYNYREINLVQLLITYIVPFLVSVYSAATFNNSKIK